MKEEEDDYVQVIFSQIEPYQDEPLAEDDGDLSFSREITAFRSSSSVNSPHITYFPPQST